MFERYTDKARRVIFFARYEATQFGSRTIESEHFLLGLLREDNDLLIYVAEEWPSAKAIHAEIKSRVTTAEQLPVSVDLPLSEECKHILRRAVTEAELLRHDSIGTEHLLLGMLGETKTLAAEILQSHGLNLETVREKIALRPKSQDGHIPSDRLPEAGVVPDAVTAMRIAEAVWIPLYGEELVKQQSPLEADLSSSVWTVRGTCQSEQAANRLVAAIAQTDGRILKIGTSVLKG